MIKIASGREDESILQSGAFSSSLASVALTWGPVIGVSSVSEHTRALRSLRACASSGDSAVRPSLPSPLVSDASTFRLFLAPLPGLADTADSSLAVGVFLDECFMLQGGGLHTVPWLLPTLSRLIIRRGHRRAWGQAPPATLPPSKGLLWPWPLISGVGNKPRKVASAKGHRETTVMAPWGPGISNGCFSFFPQLG